jgi:hypothetical protein
MNIVKKLSVTSSILLTLALPALASVNVNNPLNNSEIASPFSLSANAESCSSQAVSAMGYSLDSGSDVTIVDGTTLEAKVVSPAGTHTVHVKAWGDGGSVCVTDVVVTITSGSLAVPQDAIAVRNLQAMGNWKEAHDAGTPGSATGSMSIANSPSLSGSARKFVSTYWSHGAERYEISFGDDTTSTNFFYDAWVYFTSSASDIANLEMDMNQVMSNGQTVIYGVQCDGWSGTWDYTANTGSPKHPIDRWIHSSAPCNPRQWGINTWHHVQISYSRNDSGVVTYRSIWLDGVQHELNATVPSAFALGWGQTLLTNFQVDGLNASGTSTVYLDNLVIYRW